MLSGAVSLIECSVLFFALFKALCSIVNPKVKGTAYYLLVLLPLSILIPVVVGEKGEQDHATDD
jgi:hypothetical protein